MHRRLARIGSAALATTLVVGLAQAGTDRGWRRRPCRRVALLQPRHAEVVPQARGEGDPDLARPADRVGGLALHRQDRVLAGSRLQDRVPQARRRQLRVARHVCHDEGRGPDDPRHVDDGRSERASPEAAVLRRRVGRVPAHDREHRLGAPDHRRASVDLAQLRQPDRGLGTHQTHPKVQLEAAREHDRSAQPAIRSLAVRSGSGQLSRLLRERRTVGGYHPHWGNDVVAPSGRAIRAPFDGFAVPHAGHLVRRAAGSRWSGSTAMCATIT